MTYIFDLRLDNRIWFTILFYHLKESCTLLLQKLIVFFFLILWLILSQLELSRKELPKFTPIILMENSDHTINSVLSILFLYDSVRKTWIFEKFIFELEASYGFKITCILGRQVTSLKKKWWWSSVKLIDWYYGLLFVIF